MAEYLSFDTIVRVKVDKMKMLTLHANGDVCLRQFDQVELTPDLTFFHRIDAQGLAIK